MDEKEKNLLYHRILAVSSDTKAARIATKMLISHGNADDAKRFIEHLSSSDPAVRKVSRYILGQMGCLEAMNPLLDHLMQSIGDLTFLPDEEYKESHFFINIIEILESLFGIVKNNKIENNDLRKQLIDIFKKTKNEDLRFSLLKLIAVLGESGDYFLSIFEDLTTKEKRALYHVYSFLDSPYRLELFSLGLKDSANHEFVVPNMMEFAEGRKTLVTAIPQMNDKQKVFVLTAMLEKDGTEYLDALVELLDDENRQVVQLAADNIKLVEFSPFPRERFLEKIRNGYSFEMVKAVLSIFDHFVKHKREEDLLDAMETQRLFTNKAVILEAILRAIKGRQDVDPDFSRRFLKILLEYFKTFSEDRQDFFLTVLKVIPGLSFTQSVQIRGVRKEVMLFLKNHEEQLNQTVINNIQECLAKLNQQIAHYEESEEKIKHIEVLFELETRAIEAQRLEKLKQQLNELKEMTSDFLSRLNAFLVRLLNDASDWKVRSTSAELLSDYGTPDIIPHLVQKQNQDQSFGVRVSSSKAVESLQEKFKISPLFATVIEPLFYLSKLITEALTDFGYKFKIHKNWPDSSAWEEEKASMIWISDQFLEEEHPERLEFLFDRLEKEAKSVVIVTATPERFSKYRIHQGLKLLKKPFTKEYLTRYFTDPD